MMRWYRFIPDTAIFDFTGHVLRVCNTLLVPILAKYRISHVVVESNRRLVDATMIDIFSANDGVGNRTGEPFNYGGSNFNSLLSMVLAQKFDFRAELVWGWSSLTAAVNVKPGHGRMKGIRVCPSLRIVIDSGEGPSLGLFFSEAATMVVLQKWRNAGVTDDDPDIYDH